MSTDNGRLSIPTFVFINQSEDISDALNLFYPPRIMATKEPAYPFGRADLPEDHLGYEASKSMFNDILKRVFEHTRAFTIVYERYHVNPVYRDSYYSYFAGQHFDISRFTGRCFFFEGDYTDLNMFSPDHLNDMTHDFIGTCIIYPTEAQTLGRVLFKPQFIMDRAQSSRVRLTDYSVSVFGVRLHIRAFPFQMQDRETTRCAEVTLLNLLDYYGNTYNEYRTYLPGEIVHMEEQFTMDRTLPSRGINYAIMSRMLTRCGFSPRLYSKNALKRENGNEDDNDWKNGEMRRILHYYIESGIPVAVNITRKNSPGHSLICIGYNEKEEKDVNGEQITCKIAMINAADFYRSYVLIDDNQLPYSVREYDSLSSHYGYSVENILVPLYKRMCLEATDAYDVARYILKHPDMGIQARCKSFMEKGEDLVLRLFLASSRTYKKYRIEHSYSQPDGNRDLYRRLFGEIPFPRFLWIAELFTKSSYLDPDGLAFGEIVLDATSSTRSDAKSIIMLNYPESVAVRWPDWPISELNRHYYSDFTLSPFPRFWGNLEKIDVP